MSNPFFSDKVLNKDFQVSDPLIRRYSPAAIRTMSLTRISAGTDEDFGINDAVARGLMSVD